MAKMPEGNVIKLRGVRLSFPVLKEPRKFDDSNENEKPKFQASFLLDPTNAAHKATLVECKREIDRLISESWGTKPANMKPIDCFGKGEMKVSTQSGEVYAGYEGMFYIAASNSKRPLLKDNAGNNLTPEQADQILYGGCFVHANVNFWPQDNKFGKAIRCSLRGVVFARDGEAFGGGGATDEEFDDILGEGEIDLEMADDELGL